ncbi:MAG: hypothetical protein ACK5HY_09325 [Parahaliea sp.]
MNEDVRYSAPEAALVEAQAAGEYGSVEKGLAGDYEFRIGDIFSAAWQAIRGNKWKLNIVAAVVFLIALAYTAIVALLGFLSGTDGTSIGGYLLKLPVDLVYYAISAVVTTGLCVMGAKVSMGLPTAGTGELFRYMGRAPAALLTYILMMILILIGTLLLILPGIYLAFAYIYALPLAVEKGMSPWQALETSRKTVTHKWFTMFGFGLAIGVLFLLGALTLGIAYIWLTPFAIVAYGMVYRNLFGLEQESLSG